MLKGGLTCDHPVSHIDLYPTLADYCGLPKTPNAGKSGRPLDGHSLKPFVANPSRSKWQGPDVALVAVYGEQNPNGGPYHNFSVRSRHWRYTLYENGAEELYDHRKDPHEWTNLAKAPAATATKAQLKKKLLSLLGRR
jgi:arylsulfatase A-like enzyme